MAIRCAELGIPAAIGIGDKLYEELHEGDSCLTVRKDDLSMFKKRVGITQRVMKHPRYNEMMDCLDINWAKFLISIDILPVPLSLAPASSADAIWKILELDGLILSGGNTLVEYADATDEPESLSPERDAYEQALLKAVLPTGKPVLGVCRGSASN